MKAIRIVLLKVWSSIGLGLPLVWLLTCEFETAIGRSRPVLVVFSRSTLLLISEMSPSTFPRVLLYG